MASLNKWVVKRLDGVYVGLPLADTRADVDFWMDKLGLEGEVMTREDYEADTPEGQAEKAEKDARIAAGDAREAAEQQRIADVRARRGGGRP